MKKINLTLSLLILTMAQAFSSSCQPITTYPSQILCPTGCQVPTSNTTLNISAGSTYCVPTGQSINLQNINFNGGNLIVCGQLEANTINMNGSTPKELSIAKEATLTVNGNMNLSSSLVQNSGLIEVKGQRIHMQGSGNRFINSTTGILNMSQGLNNVEFIINSNNSGAVNEFFNYGQTLLQALRVNGSNSAGARVCLDNSSVNYNFCVREGMSLNPTTPFEVMSTALSNSSTPIIRTANSHDFQNFYNGSTPSQPIIQTPSGFIGDFNFYQGSTTNPSIAFPTSANFTPSLYGGLTANFLSNIDIDTACTPSTVPVELSFFEVKSSYNDIILKWETQSEINNDYFSIEKSEDAHTFLEIDQVLGAGTTSEVQRYTYTDSQITKGRNIYYRLKQVDFNGNFEYSEVKSIKIENDEDLKLYPNVIFAQENNVLNIEHSFKNLSDAKLEIYNFSGQMLQSINLDLQTSSQVEISSLLAGTYLVVITNSYHKIIRQIIVQ